MICLISFLNSYFSPRLLFVLLGVMVLSGCVGNVSPQLASVLPDTAPGVRSVLAQTASPQMAGGGEIIWQAERIEDSEAELLSFEMKGSGGRINTAQRGTLDKWSWFPEQAGLYQVRVISIGENGNRSKGSWSEPFEITPALEIRTFASDRSAPQMAGASQVNWSVAAIGGVGEYSITFELEHDNNAIEVVQSGASTAWAWLPDQAGSYRIRSTVEDSLGNRVESPWFESYEIVPALKVESIMPDRSTPQMAGSGPINWSAVATGGSGDLSFSFELEQNGDLATVVQSGSASYWTWSADLAGNYRVRVIVSDALGNQAKSVWSPLYEIAPPLVLESLVSDQPTPQMVGTGPFLWDVVAMGGVGGHEIKFELEKNGGTPEVVQLGDKKRWTWLPTLSGSYRIRSKVEDSLGNQVVSFWSEPFEIVPPLVVDNLWPGKSSPQAAQTTPIAWMLDVTGGVQPLNYEFDVEQDEVVRLKILTKSVPGWAWKPSSAGLYRIRASVVDARGNRIESAWSDPYEVVPPLVIQPPVAEITGPQMIDTKQIPWSVSFSGGVGETSVTFELSFNDGKPVTLASEPSGLMWKPEKSGTYRVRAVMTDSLGNQQTSEWSVPYRIEPPLLIEQLVADRPSPQAAQSVGILWTAHASGGVGDKNYAFELSRNEETGPLNDQGFKSTWKWTPEQEGSYRVRIVVTDTLGNRLTSDWTKPYEIVPALEVTVPEADSSAPQHMIHSPVSWSVRSNGGVGRKTYVYRYETKSGETESAATGVANIWKWRPAEVDFYRVRVLVTDTLGNQKKSVWSDWKEIRSPLTLDTISSSQPSPQAALKKTIRWQTEVSGGIGAVSYEFRSLMGGIESIEQVGSSPTLVWSPRISGNYRIKVRIRDEDGHSDESDWSEEYLISPAITSDSLVAILPLENLADVKASLPEFDHLYRNLLGDAFQFLPAEDLEVFMSIHRVRYTGGIGLKVAAALKEETGTEAVLISNLETWTERGSPRVALISRLVTTGKNPSIVWIDSVGLTGDDSTGLLGIGRIHDHRELLDNALKQLVASLQTYLAGTYPSYRRLADQRELRLIHSKTGTADGAIGSARGRHQPQFFYRSTSFDPAKKYSVAVIPFLNINARKHAGKIVALHTVKQFHRYANIQILEPGLIREALLKYRMVMQSGPSLAASDLLHSPNILGADIIVSGRTFDYQSEIGKSKVDFSVQAFDGGKREVLWTSRSYAVGDEGVYFFDWGKVPLAHGLTSHMTQAVINLLEE